MITDVQEIKNYKGTLFEFIEIYEDDVEIGYLKFIEIPETMDSGELEEFFDGYNVPGSTYDIAEFLPVDCLPKGTVYISQVHVNEEFQRKGYGTFLLDYLLNTRYSKVKNVILAFDESKPWLMDYYRCKISTRINIDENVMFFTINN